MLVGCVLLALCSCLQALSDDSVKRAKAPKKCQEKFSRIENHSACLPASPKVKKSGITDDDKEIILKEHNRYRSNVNPTATNMMRMSWDDEIALVAQRYADACKVLIHDKNLQRSIPGRFPCGQNLAAGSHPFGFAKATEIWYNEVKKFKKEGNNNLKVVGHYTQVVWYSSNKIGCGYAHCGTMHNYVCNYGPGGNWDVDNPYKRGPSCQDCPGHCKDNLCDCDGRVCQNQGTMNLTTCKCKCQPEPFYAGADCHLNCTGRKDPFPCGTAFKAEMCEEYSNVPQMCANMCGICPYAGVDYQKDDSDTDDGEVDTGSDKTEKLDKDDKGINSNGTSVNGTEGTSGGKTGVKSDDKGTSGGKGGDKSDDKGTNGGKGGDKSDDKGTNGGKGGDKSDDKGTSGTKDRDSSATNTENGESDDVQVEESSVKPTDTSIKEVEITTSKIVKSTAGRRSTNGEGEIADILDGNAAHTDEDGHDADNSTDESDDHSDNGDNQTGTADDNDQNTDTDHDHDDNHDETDEQQGNIENSDQSQTRNDKISDENGGNAGESSKSDFALLLFCFFCFCFNLHVS